MEEKLLIIHMDDVGMSYACNEAAKALFKRGIVTSASLMITCPWSYEFIQWWKVNSTYDVGIHTTLTCEWEDYRWKPLLGKSEVPGLIDDNGFLFMDNDEVLEKATPEEIEKEVRAQINQAILWGLKPSHLDRHMYTICMCPEYFEKYITLAKEYNIPYQMGAREYDSIDKLSERVPVKKLLDGVYSGEGIDYKSKKAFLKRSLMDMKPGFHQLTIHPVIDTPEIRRIIPSWHERYLEYQLFMDEEILEYINELGIKRVSWSDIDGYKSKS
jgi:chitin disaccharide deacetylase